MHDYKYGCLSAFFAARIYECMCSLQGAFDAYAMGNYPYPSSYMNGDDAHPLPAWPMRAACRIMTQAGAAYSVFCC